MGSSWWRHRAVLKIKMVYTVSLEQERIWKTQRKLYITVITLVECLPSLMSFWELYLLQPPPTTPPPTLLVFFIIFKRIPLWLATDGIVWRNSDCFVFYFDNFRALNSQTSFSSAAKNLNRICSNSFSCCFNLTFAAVCSFCFTFPSSRNALPHCCL